MPNPGHMRSTFTIFSNGSIIPPSFKFTELHALTLAVCSYALLPLGICIYIPLVVIVTYSIRLGLRISVDTENSSLLLPISYSCPRGGCFTFDIYYGAIIDAPFRSPPLPSPLNKRDISDLLTRQRGEIQTLTSLSTRFFNRLCFLAVITK